MRPCQKCSKTYSVFIALLEVTTTTTPHYTTRCGAIHYTTNSQCYTFTNMFAPHLHVQVWLHVAGSRDCAPCHKLAKRQVTVAFSITTTTNYTTLTFRYTTLQLQLHFTAFHYSTLHYTTLHSHYTTLNCTTHSTTLHSITLHYTTLYYTTLHSTTLHYTNYTTTTTNYNYTTTTTTTLDLHYATLHYTNYTTLHYTPLHYAE